MAYGYDILAPGNITRVMQETQDKVQLPRPLLWYNRAAKVEASDDEMTLREKSHIFAADIISTDSRAAIRDSGEFSFDRHGMNKIKHGYGINESMTKLLRRIEKGTFLDNEVLTFRNYVSRKQAELVIGVQQRVESMLNGMFCDEYDYARFGIKVEGSWGMRSDLKFTPTDLWNDTTNATPLYDIVAALHYADRHYGEQYNRITGTYNQVAAIVATDEFNAVYKAERAAWNYDNATIEVGNASPMSRIGFLSSYLSAQVGWQVTFEVDEGHYREFSPSNLRAPGRFHPDTKLYFTVSGDDGGSTGWDVGNGEVLEQLFAELAPGNVIGAGSMDSSSPYGPFGYTTLANPTLNPPGMVMWCAAWMAPRKHRDTCTAVMTVLPANE